MKLSVKKITKSVTVKGLVVGLTAGIVGSGLSGCGFVGCNIGRGLSKSTTDLTKKYVGERFDGKDTVAGEMQITEEFQKSYMDFSLQLLKESRNLASGTSGTNTMVSPLSVMMALEMTRSGARGETAREMETVLYQQKFAEDGKRELMTFVRGLSNTEKAQLHLANSIWFHTGDTEFVVDEDFLKNAAEDYGAEIYGAPFDESTRLDINKWVELETDGMIKDVLDNISQDAIMYLVNGLAFEAEWEDVYETNQIHDAEFYPAEGDTQKVSMMYSEEGTYLEDAHAIGFSKPYAKGYEFAALLPEEGMTLEEYIGGLTGADLVQILNPAEETTASNGNFSVGIPKFKAETSTELSVVLKKMGMPMAFDEDYADFSGMGRMGNAEEDAPGIFINRVLHKTYIEVDELGTKAGAATVVEMNTESCAIYEKEPVILNRPFFYAIVDTETKLPIFIGTMETADEK